MPGKPKKSSNFFHELKRRNVYRVLAMYAGAAFVIIELTNNVVEPLGLPVWLPTLIILLLIAGFPVTAILSWIFDLTPEGMKKTPPLEASPENEEVGETGIRRRLRPSDIVIGVLIMAILVLVYPKVFNQDDLKDARDNDGKIPIAVLPFENLTGDTLLDTWQGGLQNLLITTLSNSEELTVRQYQSTNSAIGSRESYASFTPKLVREVATKLEIQTLIKGTFMKSGNEIRMDAQLIDAENDEIYKTFQVDGDSESDFFSMADSLTRLIKNYVEIKNIKEKRNSSIIQAEGYTRSSEAFKYYMHGLDAIMDMDMGQAVDWFTKAVEIDSMFINAQIFLAHAYHMYGAEALARQIVTQTYDYKGGLAVADKLMLEHLHAYFFETPFEEIKYSRQLVDLDEMNPIYWHSLAVAHYKVNEFEEAVSCWEKLFALNEKWGSPWQNPFAYFMLADSYHQLEEYTKEGEILALGNRLFPKNGYIQFYRAIWAVTQEDTVLTHQIMEDYLSFRHNVTNCPEALISNDIGFIYSSAGLFDEAEQHFRSAIRMEPQNLQYHFNLAMFLIDEEVDVDEGVEIVDRLLESIPDHWNLLNYKGWGLYKKGRYEEAVELLRHAWEKKPLYNHMLFLHLQEAEKAASA